MPSRGSGCQNNLRVFITDIQVQIEKTDKENKLIQISWIHYPLRIISDSNDKTNNSKQESD